MRLPLVSAQSRARRWRCMRASRLLCPWELCAACFRFVAIRGFYVARGALLCSSIYNSSALVLRSSTAFAALSLALAAAKLRACRDCGPHESRVAAQAPVHIEQRALRRIASISAASAVQSQQSRSSCAVAAHSQTPADDNHARRPPHPTAHNDTTMPPLLQVRLRRRRQNGGSDARAAARHHDRK